MEGELMGKRTVRSYLLSEIVKKRDHNVALEMISSGFFETSVE